MSTAGPGVVSPSPPSALRPTGRSIATAAACAASVLAVTSTGSMVVAAVLLGVATADRRSGAAAVLAVVATSLRFVTAGFDDLAGIQSVLGAAGVVGPALAGASAWAAAAAVLLAARAPAVDGGDEGLWRFGPAVAAGLLAATVVAGPGPSDLALRVAASVVGVVLAAGVTVVGQRPGPARLRPVLALASGAAAVVLAGWPT